ncbi:hypothetical protein BN381_210047 [Candidatus Microthrix parvicella RN1]|uniref:Uncharacterized protein n=1 Tax=Candidatus Neomicrothrix parvicella RN1 TaxID=1229780 RepID=R4Z492_9ACTN|nr:hypothetical protein BN381_210047 [Candidatus Microthrix parvicella RN1]
MSRATRTARRPASVISPAASISATRRRFSRVQELFGFRGVSICNPRSSSSVPAVESIQPKQIASSTSSGYGHLGLPVGVRHEHSQTPLAVSWCRSNQARTWPRDSAWYIGYSNFHTAGWLDDDGDTVAITTGYGPVVTTGPCPRYSPVAQELIDPGGLPGQVLTFRQAGRLFGQGHRSADEGPT